MRTRAWPLFSAAVLLAALGGCAKPPPPELRVDGRNFGAFYYWRSSVSSRFTPERWREFNDAVQELRLQAMGRGTSGTDAINAAMCREVNGRTIDEVLRLGDEAKLERLLPLRDRLKTMVDVNALLAAKPGDVALEEDLAERRAAQEQRLRQLVAEIEAAKRSLIAHGGRPLESVGFDPRPAVLTRYEALKEFHHLIESRLYWASAHYGDWPATIDRDGALLPEEQRGEFLERRAAARLNGHEVIGVQLRACWRIYDDIVHFPEFSDSVTGNLTEADRRDLREAWANSQAEIWARKQASQESSAGAVAKIRSDVRALMGQK